MENQNTRPVGQITPNYSIIKYILLSIVTLGIYSIIWHSKISTDINSIASRYDGRRTMNGALVYLLLSWLTFGIALLVWKHNISGRIGKEVERRGLGYKISSADFWLWCILGSIILVGPMIYIHKKCVAMNKLAADYNVNG